MLHAARQMPQLFQIATFLLGIDLAMQLAQHHGQLEQCGQLGGEGLGRGHANLGAGTGVADQFAGARDRAFRHVADRQRMQVTERLGVFERFHRVQGFTGLGDGDDQMFGIGVGGAVAVLAGDFHAARQAGDGFDPIACGQASVVAGAAGQDLHALDVLEHGFGVLAEQRCRETTCINRGFDGVGQRARLFVDFLLHEVAVRAQLQRGQRHIRHALLALRRGVVGIEYAHAVAGQLGGVSFFQEYHPTGGLQDRRHIGGDEVLALAQPHQQRATHACHHHALGLVFADHRQCVGAGQFLDRALQGAEQVVLIGLEVMMDQVRYHLGIGLRFEHITQRQQLLALLLVVLDDAVVHQRHALADMRMGIGLGDTAMRRPAGMADAQHRMELLGDGRPFHFGNAAGAPHAADVLGVEHGNAGGIVAAVFQPLESFNQYRNHIATSDRSHNPAHSLSTRDYERTF